MRPLHRWKSLWLGILVLIFLTWAWWDSTRFHSIVVVNDYTVAHAGTGICIARWNTVGKTYYRSDRSTINSHYKAWMHPRLEAPRLLHYTAQRDEDSIQFVFDPETLERIPRNSAACHFAALLSGRTPGTWGLFLPHWLLIATFLIPWLTFLIWRTRRLRHPKP